MNSPPPTLCEDDFYQTLVENAAEGMLTIDQESKIVYSNPAVEEILGYSQEELIGSSKMKIIPERLESVHAAALDAYVDTGERNIDWDGMELPALHKEGHEVPTLISLREHEHNGDQYFTGIIRDITEQQRREEQLQEQRDRLNEFADILTHDIRTPLSVAQGYTEVAQENHNSPELDEVSESLDRIDTLVDTVLELSKSGQLIGETEPIDIEAYIHKSWDSVETQEDTLQIDDELGQIVADTSRFQELLENLFRNAVDHSDEAVRISVGSLAEEPGIYVADDGPGIPSSVHTDVFEHGYSTNQAGTGYGLSIVQQVVQGHGWEIDITESAEGGARFEIKW
ncbi:PAS domain S-box protein [Natronorubrum sp. JWXQ-INN-674]|uniref:histidine kinase n=2 Tax=Natrialbaceae TaxID=1644061 RepID=A0A4V3VKV3_9EURY|nr:MULTISPECIES: PAS domain-containing sensor histidine kinase [Natrialbaceae]MXV61625.1 PAS domain S-box protein [Natronorubrum halalkaliphilum]THE63127.1 PAS domain S-box protein [Salinadaptatus halalkaliphilus]